MQATPHDSAFSDAKDLGVIPTTAQNAGGCDKISDL